MKFNYPKEIFTIIEFQKSILPRTTKLNYADICNTQVKLTNGLCFVSSFAQIIYDSFFFETTYQCHILSHTMGQKKLDEQLWCKQKEEHYVILQDKANIDQWLIAQLLSGNFRIYYILPYPQLSAHSIEDYINQNRSFQEFLAQYSSTVPVKAC